MRFPQSRWLNSVGMAVFLITVTLLILLRACSDSKGYNARASEAFGKALEKEGIPTQAGPSK